ncbi:hypothetical protein SAMN04488168_10354 [Bacillus sp. 491mf]|nr:hypothetical protein SAMN04488168_10354 [Bacillus sp. 491mf]
MSGPFRVLNVSDIAEKSLNRVEAPIYFKKWSIHCEKR